MIRHGYTVEVYPRSAIEDPYYPYRIPMIVRGGAWFLATEARVTEDHDADAVKEAMDFMVRDGIACALDDEQIAQDAELTWVSAQWEEEETS